MNDTRITEASLEAESASEKIISQLQTLLYTYDELLNRAEYRSLPERKQIQFLMMLAPSFFMNFELDEATAERLNDYAEHLVNLDFLEAIGHLRALEDQESF